MASTLLSFLTVLMTTRMLGPRGYATVALVGVVASLLFTTSTAWTGVSVRRYGREDLERSGELSRLTWNRVVIGLPITIMASAAIVALRFLDLIPSSFSWPLVGLALSTGLATIIVDHWVCLLETSGRFKVSAAGQVLSQAGYVGAIAFLFVSASHGSPTVVLSLVLASTVTLAIGLAPFVWRRGVVPVSVDAQLLRRMLWLSAPMIGLMVAQYVLASVDVIVLRMFRSQTDVGVYAVAYQAYTVLSAAAISVTAVLTPLFVSLRMAGRQNLVEGYIRSATPQALLVIACGFALVIPTVSLMVPVVFGDSFSAATEPLAILVVGLAFLFAAYLVAPILTLYEQTRAIALFTCVAAVINVVGDVVMLGVLHMGIEAPAVATDAGLLYLFLAFFWRARRLLGVATRPPLRFAAPLVVGLVSVLALNDRAGVAAGFAAVLLTSTAVIVWHCPFRAEDLALIEKLELPVPVKAIAVKAIARLARQRSRLDSAVS